VHRTVRGEGGGDLLRLRRAGRHARRREHRDLVHHQRGVLHEHGVGKSVERGEHDYLEAGGAERRAVACVLNPSPRHVDRLPIDKGELALGEAGARLPGESDGTTSPLAWL